ncbi:ferrichrome ABC transporter substrate-binding protein [Clostridium neonatale]|uniref:Ferrichrome ABC transporter substrate-binding protein n=1 Tax=Clostridium neonatale TaxID=137838 RepID=A0A2A7MEH3_9CLOT|nr:iron-hydroxamate ABC transporter substrate-binding protein [Clostridium neonatale]PEG25627.1 ferrichrome ABC transporter substrate-binding protein [Clostridium neonatale]PEG30095.1 ferrichrome ABC transporter substrate-binding protein [Clostridium neonatale]CAH0435962.1 Iron(3+)-hydroxamate ABC transporter, substrate-binding protein [Clostridium neonatale]
MKKIKKIVAGILTVAMIGIITGCSSNDGEANNSGNKTMVVESLKGNVEIPANPERIVDISGSSEELLILGYTPVGTANIDSYNTTEVASYVKDQLGSAKVVGHSMMETMDMEAILACNPDLIIMSERQSQIYDQLKEIAPTVMIKDYGNDWRDRLTDIAKMFNKEDEATEWLSNYDETAKKLGEEVAANNGEESYLPVLSSSGQFMVFSDAGIGTIINEDMGLARPENLPVQDGITLPMLSIEGLAEIDADHIVLIATDADKAELEENSVWQNIRAVKEGNITILNASPYFSQSYNPIGRLLLLESLKNELMK